MFPSDDPFAYPAQPMSTLEDGHFRQEGQRPTPFGLDPTTSQQPTMPGTQAGDLSGTMGPSFDSFSNFPVFTNGVPTAMGSTTPGQFQSHKRQVSQSQLQSPVSRSSAPNTGEPVSSPDLVSIPNRNFAWQNYNFDQQNMPEQMPAVSGSQGFDMNMDNDMGVGLDLGIPLDEILGNDAFRPAGSFTNDDWTQWMNVGI